MEPEELGNRLREEFEGIKRTWDGTELLTLDEKGVPVLETTFQIVEGGNEHMRVYEYRIAYGGWQETETSGPIHRETELMELFPYIPKPIIVSLDDSDIMLLKRKWVVIYSRVSGEDRFVASGFSSQEEFKQELRNAYASNGDDVHSIYCHRKPIKYKASVNISLESE